MAALAELDDDAEAAGTGMFDVPLVAARDIGTSSVFADLQSDEFVVVNLRSASKKAVESACVSGVVGCGAEGDVSSSRGVHSRISREDAAYAALQNSSGSAMGLLKAPKRVKGRRPLGEGRSVQKPKPPSPLQEAATEQDLLDMQDASGEWCRAAPEGRQDLFSGRRRNWHARFRHTAAVRAAREVPAWARWGRAGKEAETDENGRTDRWAADPGALFERLCFEFVDGEEDEESTCDGGDEEEATDMDEEGYDVAVVTGYRADVGEGCGLPNERSDDTDQDVGICREGVGQEEEGGLEHVDDSSASRHSKITDILFVVHGMGATDEGLACNVRELTSALNCMRDFWFWHTNLEVHVEMVSWKEVFSATQTSIFDRITPAEKMKGTRMTINSTLSDILFYKHPHYRAKIHEILISKMNSRVCALRDDPSGRFSDARVSIVGHSLGSVITYDILTLPQTEPRQLEFKVDHFFLWGSPLAAFISIADENNEFGEFVLPESVSVCNIFHPQDPVAFRLEPLYYPDQEQVSPATIPYHGNNGSRSSKQWAQSYEYAKSVANQKWLALKNSIWEAIGATAKVDFTRQQFDLFMNADQDFDAVLGTRTAKQTVHEQAEETVMKPKMRIDHALQEQTIESVVESLGLLQSHFCYWRSHDVALFMLEKLSQEPAAAMNSDERDKQLHENKGDASGVLSVLPLPEDFVKKLGNVSCVRRDESGEF